MTIDKQGASLYGKPMPERSTLEELYIEKRWSMNRIAKYFGVSDRLVKKWLIRCGFPIRNISQAKLASCGAKVHSKPTKEELQRLYLDEQLTEKAIGAIFGVSDVTIGHWLKSYGIHIRRTPTEFRTGKACPWMVEIGRKVCRERNMTDNPAKRPEVKAKRSKQQSEIMKRIWKERPETYANMLESVRRSWSDPSIKSFLLHRMHTGKNRATRAELAVKEALDQSLGCFQHTSVTGKDIGGKIPDFLDAEHRIIVEVMGRWYHDKTVNPGVDFKRTPEYTIAHYQKYGYNTLIIWTEELKRKGWQERLINRVNQMIKENESTVSKEEEVL